jgi:type I restriction-modification system DNA methylase subunit
VLITKQQAYNKIAQLIERFSEHIEEYKRGSYNEHQTRVDYINPFFKALGWDMAYQVRRYGWSAKVPLSIVTDFEEFSIYDCTKKPKPTDKASVSRIKYLTYDRYLEEFDFLWDVFAKENLPKGRFDKYVQSDTRKKGTATVDDEFLKSIEQWRTYLATSIALRNKSLNVDELNYAVQKIIDRIIFLRMCEDRGVEQYGNLKKAAAKGEVYQNLFGLYRIADDKYNSGLFDFKEDKITPGLTIDNKVLKTIIKELYYPECEYEFSVMPADILGSVYERFLGKTIRLTPAHYAKIEEKPEVRKAGGVYYTPKYIVDYIVENTVGKLIEGKTPKQVEKIKICDPACGSGSFLIGAYQYLLDWHLKYYTNNPPRKKKDSSLTPDGNLTTAEKKQILLNNIFGVDIDTQAVEVTKLNLLLKALEGETLASINRQLSLFHERVLPNLNQNIKCGNSLIGPDFYDNQLEIFPEQIKKINAFDWEEGFPEIMSPSGGSAGGGFDVVIGNPPYVRQELLGDHKDYFKNHYKVYHGMADLYAYFFEKGINILNKKGVFGIIVANKWMRARYGEPLRKWLKGQNIHEIIDFGDLPVFQNATTYPCIFIAGNFNDRGEKFSVVEIADLHFKSLKDYVSVNKKEISNTRLNDAGWQLVSDDEAILLAKLQQNAVPLGKYVNGKIYRGVLTGFNEAFVIDKATKDRLIAEDPKSAEIIKPFLAGRDIKRYQPPQSDKYLLFTRRGIYIDEYPAIKYHLTQYKDQLMPKPKGWKGENWKGRKPGSYEWYEIQDTIAYWQEFEISKIMYQVFQVKPCFIYDTNGYFSNNAIWIIPTKDLKLLGILNSKLGWYLITKYCTKIQNGYQLIYKYLEMIPIIVESLSSANYQTLEEQISQKAETLLSLNQRLTTTRLETQRQQIQRTINHAEKKIDELVYELYGLSEEEIRIIEDN